MSKLITHIVEVFDDGRIVAACGKRQFRSPPLAIAKYVTSSYFNGTQFCDACMRTSMVHEAVAERKRILSKRRNGY